MIAFGKRSRKVSIKNRRPNIYNFKNPADFINSYFNWRKSNEDAFTIRKWAYEMNMKPDVLSALIKGKKDISIRLVEIMTPSMGLDTSEQTYFEALQKYASAPTLKEKQMFELVLAEFAGLRGSKHIVEDTSIFSHWIYMAILSIVHLHNFNCNEDNISNVLMNDVPKEFIKLALNKLLNLGLLSKDQNGNLVYEFNHATTKNDAFKGEVHEYYNQVAELSKNSFNLPLEEREFQCFTLPVIEDQLPVFKEAIRQFRSKVASLAVVGSEFDRVYQFNIQFFPLTKKLNHLKSKSSEMNTSLQN